MSSEVVLTTAFKTNQYNNDDLVNYMEYKLNSIGQTSCVSYEYDESDKLISYVFITHVKIPDYFLKDKK